jgi:hypothetical protein
LPSRLKVADRSVYGQYSTNKPAHEWVSSSSMRQITGGLAQGLSGTRQLDGREIASLENSIQSWQRSLVFFHHLISLFAPGNHVFSLGRATVFSFRSRTPNKVRTVS